jgi:menaquinone-9 beta-reductase
MIFDLAVIGAGPAGCAAAIVAARKGARVLLLEARGFPRHKVCGEFVSAEALRLLEQLLSGDFHTLTSRTPRISRANLFFDKRMFKATIHPPAASIARFDLDLALWNACRANRVECRDETKVRGIETSGALRVLAAHAGFEAQAVLNASGRWSSLSARTAAPRHIPQQKWVGIKAHFDEPAASSAVDLYFFEGGYCGVQPVRAGEDGRGSAINVCTMVRADIASTIGEALTCHPLLGERSRRWKRLMEPLSTSPLLFSTPKPVDSGMLQVGDAAGFVDPFVGDGISLALRSGALAAECLMAFFERKCSLAEASERYSRAYQRSFRHVFTNGARLRRILGWPEFVRKPLVSVAASIPFVTTRIVKMTR